MKGFRLSLWLLTMDDWRGLDISRTSFRFGDRLKKDTLQYRRSKAKDDVDCHGEGR